MKNFSFNINGGEEASFFKILLRDSEDYLPLPPAFAKKYLEKPNIRNQEVVLKTKSGDKWNVEYLKIDGGYYFVGGWLDFMKANHLRNDDFIVFWLLSSPNNSFSSSSKLTFQVFPYAPNGCLKYPSTSDNAAARRRKKTPAPVVKEETSGDTNENTHQSTVSMVVKKSYTNRLPLRKIFLKVKGIGEYGSMRLKNDDEKEWELAIKKHGVPEQMPWLMRGWSEFRKNNNIKFGNTCEFRHVEDNLFHVRVIKKRGSSRCKSNSNRN